MWPNLQFHADLVTFTEEILNGKLHFCAVLWTGYQMILLETLQSNFAIITTIGNREI